MALTWAAVISPAECARDCPAALTVPILPQMDSVAIGLAIALARSAAIPAWIPHRGAAVITTFDDAAISSRIALARSAGIPAWIPHPGAVAITTFDDVEISSPTASARSAVTTTLGLVGGAIEEIGVGAGGGATTIPGCGVRGTTMITGSIATTIASAPSPSSGTNNN